MSDALWFGSGLGAAAGAGWWSWQRWQRARVRRRLEAPEPGVQELADDPARRPLIRSHRVAAALLGALVGAALGAFLGGPWIYTPSFAAVASVLALLIEDLRSERRLLKVEADLGDAIDLLVGALRAGAGLGAAISTATPRLPEPLRELFEDMERRLRLGETPRRIFAEPAERVPLPSFQLLSLSLTTQMEAGGNLASSLALVGRSVRDRVALARRVRTQSASALGSVLGFLGITYGIGVLMWLWEPRQVEIFLATAVGAGLVSAALILQALGLLWIRALVRIEL